VALERYTAVRDVLEDPQRPATWAGPVMLAMCMGGRAMALLQVGRVAESAEDGSRALDLARESGLRGLEAMAMACLSIIARYNGDRDAALKLAREALEITDEFAGGLQRALSHVVAGVLIDAGDLSAADQACTAALASCRQVGDMANLGGVLWHMTILDLRVGRLDDATAHLIEQLHVATQTGVRPILVAGLDCCGRLCAATRRPAEAVTVWAAMSALSGRQRLLHEYLNRDHRDDLERNARKVLGPAGTRAAQERGAAMGLATATEYALMLAAQSVPQAEGAAAVPGADTDGAAAPALAGLSPRERELITLVAQGRTDAQIAAQLYITVRTVSSHLDRIRDKTGCRRRADLTRLALGAGLV
jgi:DNA-binding CsgD family transcriptional regulator